MVFVYGCWQTVSFTRWMYIVNNFSAWFLDSIWFVGLDKRRLWLEVNISGWLMKTHSFIVFVFCYQRMTHSIFIFIFFSTVKRKFHTKQCEIYAQIIFNVSRKIRWKFHQNSFCTILLSHGTVTTSSLKEHKIHWIFQQRISEYKQKNKKHTLAKSIVPILCVLCIPFSLIHNKC